MGEIVDSDLRKRLRGVLEKYFDFSSDKVLGEELRREWREAIVKCSSKVSSQDEEFLTKVLEEIEEIIVHMPGKSMVSKALDWQKWQSEDDFLGYLLLRESLQYPLTASVFENLKKDLQGSGIFERPYRDNKEFQGKIRLFIRKYASNTSE